MFTKFLSLRVNFAIVFAGSLLVILLTKMLSALLPSKYYFNFSTLVGGSSEPFIVDPPTVTGPKLCEVMERYGIPPSTFNRSIPCQETLEGSLSQDEIDQIYSIAFSSDQAVRNAFAETLRRVELKLLTDDEVRELISNNSTAGQAFETIFSGYVDQIGSIAGRGPRDAITALYKPVDEPISKKEEENISPATPKADKIPEDTVVKILQAHRDLKRELSNPSAVIKIPAIRKSQIDAIIHRPHSSLGGAVSDFYTGEMAMSFRSLMSQSFSRLGLPTGKDYDQKLIFSEINSFSWKDYVLAALLRATPVFLFGLVMGVAFGRPELFSVALAGGLAAFLLAWPLILMWNRLVQGSWADKQPLFFSLYGIYVISFFLTSRAAALLGTCLREQNLLRLPVLSKQAAVPGLRVGWREVTVNVTGAAIINAAVYLWNLYLPLSAAAAR
jgi:hypothetical protein